MIDLQLSPEELRGLQSLDTDDPVKPNLPATIADRLIELELVIPLVEGGLQLTTLGREILLTHPARNY